MIKYKGPVVTIIMDGIGLNNTVEGNAVKTPIHQLWTDLCKIIPWYNCVLMVLL